MNKAIIVGGRWYRQSQDHGIRKVMILNELMKCLDLIESYGMETDPSAQHVHAKMLDYTSPISLRLAHNPVCLSYPCTR